MTRTPHPSLRPTRDGAIVRFVVTLLVLWFGLGLPLHTRLGAWAGHLSGSGVEVGSGEPAPARLVWSAASICGGRVPAGWSGLDHSPTSDDAPGEPGPTAPHPGGGSCAICLYAGMATPPPAAFVFFVPAGVVSIERWPAPERVVAPSAPRARSSRGPPVAILSA